MLCLRCRLDPCAGRRSASRGPMRGARARERGTNACVSTANAHVLHVLHVQHVLHVLRLACASYLVRARAAVLRTHVLMRPCFWRALARRGVRPLPGLPEWPVQPPGKVGMRGTAGAPHACVVCASRWCPALTRCYSARARSSLSPPWPPASRHSEAPRGFAGVCGLPESRRPTSPSSLRRGETLSWAPDSTSGPKRWWTCRSSSVEPPACRK